jgi:hypothetical protein
VPKFHFSTAAPQSEEPLMHLPSSWTGTTAELDVAKNGILSQGMGRHFFFSTKCSLVLIPTVHLGINNFSLLSFPQPLQTNVNCMSFKLKYFSSRLIYP